MIVRYATTQDGIDNECVNVCCASEEIIQKEKEKYYKNYKHWIIERDLVNKGRIFKKEFYAKELKFSPSKINLLDFESQEIANNYLQNSLKDKNLGFIQTEDIEDKEGKFEGFEIKYRVVPYSVFSLPHIGSYACEHCPYCYGRSKRISGFELIGWNDRVPELDYIDDNWDFEKEEEQKMKNRYKNLKMREAHYIKCSAIYIQNKINWKIKVKRYLYQLWVNKWEQPLIAFCKKYHIKPLYNKLNYGWWF